MDVVFKNGGTVELRGLTTIRSGVVFKNEDHVYLDSLTSIPSGVMFGDAGSVLLLSLVGGWFSNWEGNIEGIDSNRLLNSMISKGVFER